MTGVRILISPAKKMNTDIGSLPFEQQPQFLEEAQLLLRQLRGMDFSRLKALWNCSDAIADQNYQRLQHMNLHRALTPAILAYEGIQYRHMAPGVFDEGQFDYIRAHLRILSGFYGLLRPFDGVAPYRLEMQAMLSANGFKNLYAFWGARLAEQLASESDLILNLASKEYSRAVLPHLPPSVRVLTCVFGERQGEKIVEKGTLCKIARGEMVRWLAAERITDPGAVKGFNRLGYAWQAAYSGDNNFVFLKEKSSLTD